MINFTRTLALELAEHRIRVNCIAPDLVPTAVMERYAPSLVSPEGKAAQARYIPVGRAGNLDDCAGPAVFLASAMASYITGVTISVDGGPGHRAAGRAAKKRRLAGSCSIDIREERQNHNKKLRSQSCPLKSA